MIYHKNELYDVNCIESAVRSEVWKNVGFNNRVLWSLGPRVLVYTYWYIITPFGWYKHVKIVCCEGSLCVIAHSRKKKLFLDNVGDEFYHKNESLRHYWEKNFTSVEGYECS